MEELKNKNRARNMEIQHLEEQITTSGPRQGGGGSAGLRLQGGGPTHVHPAPVPGAGWERLRTPLSPGTPPPSSFTRLMQPRCKQSWQGCTQHWPWGGSICQIQPLLCFTPPRTSSITATASHSSCPIHRTMAGTPVLPILPVPRPPWWDAPLLPAASAARRPSPSAS